MLHSRPTVPPLPSRSHPTPGVPCPPKPGVPGIGEEQSGKRTVHQKFTGVKIEATHGS